MTRKLFGLLWFLSTGSAERNVDSGVECALFSGIDGQRDQDNNIVFEEFYQAWSSCDKNNDSYISKDEVVAAIEQLQVGENSYLESSFGNQNFSFFQKHFKMIDKNSDGFISLSEFESYYKNDGITLNAMDRKVDDFKKRPKIFSQRSKR